MNIFPLLSLLYLLLSLTTKAQESVQILPLHDSTEEALQAPPLSGQQQQHLIAVQVETEHLKNVSKSVLMAETWVRNYVLPYYPANNITTLIVGHTVFCHKDRENKLGLILPAIKNIHYSLTRWGLQNDIKPTTSFSSDCLNSDSEEYRFDLAENHIKPLLTILQEIGSPYVVNPPTTPNPHTLSDSTLNSHSKSIKNLGVFGNRVNLVIISPRNEKPTNRKLSFIDTTKTTVPPLPPLIGTISPSPNSAPLSPISPPFVPHLAPMATPPYGPHLPPCEPSGIAPPTAGGPHRHGLWCVAKPSVPPETLQEGLDYACGVGGADCEAIRRDGSCYFPDTVVAHASYAFNSYWQKNKKHGGSCGFGGTAMLISSDPSYRRCRFILE